MGWNNFSFTGNGTTPETDDAETATILETGDSSLTLPYSIQIVDMVLNATATEAHEYRIYVNGKAQGSQLRSGLLNPASQGRFSIANQNIKISAGATLQMKGSQKTDTAGAAETSIATLEYVTL
jgi:hypothetical protein